REPTFDACNRFFSVGELVDILFDNADIRTLLTCSRVCRQWNIHIEGSQKLQKNLFLTSEEPRTQAKGHLEAEEVQINPMLFQYFGPILAPSSLNENDPPKIMLEKLAGGEECTYDDISKLPFARDGQTLESAVRRAFARGEASWRRMLVSQPPIRRLDWWHSWIDAHCYNTEQGGHDCHRFTDGSGHQDYHGDVTLGMLWDLVEGRLVRGCTATVKYFPYGQAVPKFNRIEDRVEREERIWKQDGQRRFTSKTPRIKIQTYQTWNYSPRPTEGFNMATKMWEKNSGNRKCTASDGFNVLRGDCASEHRNPPRWSKSEGYQWGEIDGESS
ncbi:hypothetical protein BS50DRAFT_461933, partial [Corynespora cassiicola Philippines]